MRIIIGSEKTLHHCNGYALFPSSVLMLAAVGRPVPERAGLQHRPAQSHGPATTPGPISRRQAVWVATVLRAEKVCPHWLLPRAFTAVLCKHA